MKDDKSTAGTLVKDLLSKSLKKGGKLKAIKVKIKFGGGSNSKPKRHVNHGPAGRSSI